MGGKRVFQPRRTREEVDELLAGSTEADVRSELIRLGVRRLVEEVLEAEVDDRLGREYYRHGADGARWARLTEGDRMPQPRLASFLCAGAA